MPDILHCKAMALNAVTEAETLTVSNIHAPAGTSAHLRRFSWLTWPCMQQPRVREARGRCSLQCMAGLPRAPHHECTGEDKPELLSLFLVYDLL